MSKAFGTTQERAAHYRELALEAEKCAEKSVHPDMRENYLSVARSWNALASEAEAWAQRMRMGV